MSNGGRIDVTWGYKTDTASYNAIKTQLQDLTRMASQMSNNNIMGQNSSKDIQTVNTELEKSRKIIQEVETAYDEAFDSTTGVTNINKLSQSLKGLGVKDVENAFTSLGTKGVQAWNNITSQITKANFKFRETNNFLSKMGETLSNTVKWGIASSALNKFTGSVQEAWGYVKHLDTSLNDIRIVTGKSADEMDKFAVSANNAAQRLGAATTEYTEAALIYYQQGLADDEAAARAETTIKAANVTGQTGKQVSEELTAVWNGYKVTAEETELYVDKLAAVAASTASDLEELSTGMSKVASAANNMGVDVDQLNAQLATIISVTRQAPETAGTALKTIYARMEDLKISGEDEYGVKLGDVSSTLDEVGVHIMDVNGDIRDLGEVIEEVGNKWYTWTEAQRSAIAQAIAGKRQYNNLLALFDNWDKYNKALETSQNATGTLQKQQDIYMESTAAHIQQLETEWEGLYDSLIDNKDVNKIIDSITFIVDKFNSFIDIVGGGKSVLAGLIGLLGQIPGITTSISNQLGSIMTKMINAKINAQEWANVQTRVKEVLPDSTHAHIFEEISQYENIMTNENRQQILQYADEIKALEDQKVIKQDLLQLSLDQIKAWEQGLELEGQIGTEEHTDIQNLSALEPISKDSQDNLNYVIEEEENAYKEAKEALQEYLDELDKFERKRNEYDKAINEDKWDVVDKRLDDLAKIDDELTSKEKNLRDLLTKISSGNEEAVDSIIRDLNSTRESVKDIDIPIEKLDSDIKDLGTTGQKEFGKISSNIQETKKAIKSTIPEINNTSDALAQAKANLQDYINNLAMDSFADGITKTVTGLSSLAFGIQSIQNLGSIWKNEDASTGEKILSTITALSVALPMLTTGLNTVYTGFNKISDGLKVTTALMGGYVSGETAMSIANTFMAYTSEEERKALLEESLARKLNSDTLDEETAKLLVDSLAKSGNLNVSNALGKIFRGKLIGSIKNVGTGFESMASAVGVSTAALGALLAVIAAVAAAVVAYNAVLAKERALELENAKARYETAKEHTEGLQEEKNAVDELINSYESLNSQYEEHSISMQTLRNKVYDLAIQYGNEELAIKSLTGSYEDLNNAINQLQSNKNIELIDSAETEQEALQDKFKKTLWKDLSKKERDQGWNTELGQYVDAIDLKGYDVQNASERKLQTDLENLGIKSYAYGHIDLDDFIKVATESREELQQVLDKSETDAAEQLQGYLDTYAEDLDRYTELEETVVNAQQENRNITLKDTDIQSDKDAKKAYDEYIKAAQEEGLSWEEANQQFKEYASTMDNQFIKNMADLQVAKDYIESGYLEAAVANNVDTSDWDIHEETDKILEQLQAAGYSLEDTSFLTKEQWRDYYLGNLSFEDIVAEIEEGQRQSLEQTKNDFLNNDVTQFNADLNSIIQNAISGNLTADDETYVNLSEQLESIKEAFPELTDEANTFLTEGLIGTEKWTEAAYKLQEAFDQAELQRLNETFKDELNDVTPDLNTDEFKSEMEELLDADYSISVKVYADGIEEFENAEDALDNMDEMASKIGDDFIVAADDIRELNNTFPGILDGMEYLADGTVQLNEEMVKSAMSMATEEELASTDATATKLENTASELRAKAEVYENMAELAYESAEDQTKAESNKAEIVKQLEQIEADNDEITTNTEIDNSNLVANVSASDAQTLANNWTQAYQDAATAANEWADVALAAQNAVDSGDSSLKKTDFNTNFSGSNYSGSTASSSASSAKLKNTDTDSVDWNSLGEELSAQAEAYRSSANDLEGAATELRAKALGSANTNADAADGTTSDDSSSGSSSEADTEEYLEREEDLYQEINDQLDEIEDKLGRIDTIQSHTWGINYANNLKTQNDLLKDQIDLLEEKKDTYESDLSNQRSELESQGFTFNESGSSITNQQDVLNELYDEYNSMVDTYNSMTADEQDTYESTLEAKKDAIDEIEDAIDDYNDAYDNYNDTLDELLDAHYELIENEVNSFNASIDVQLELDDAKEEWNDFWYEVIEDVEDTDFGGKIAQSLGKLDTLIGTVGNQSSSEVSTLTEHLSLLTDEVNKQIASADRGGEDSMFKDDTALSKETIETYRDDLMDAVRSAKEEIDDMMDTYLDALDEMNDKIDDHIDGWKAVGDNIEHNVELIQLVSGEEAFDAIGKQYEQLYQNNLTVLEADRMAKEEWQTQVDRYSAIVNSMSKDDDRYSMYVDALDKAKENLRDAISRLDDDLIDALKDRQDQFKNTAAEIAKELDRAMSGGIGMDRMKNEWDLAIEEQEHYLDNVERSFNMEELDGIFNDILEGMEGRNDLQQEFLKFQDEEIAKLNERDKLTQYDIDELKARLEIKKQELALEEAQQNKSNLRLRRDSQGNYNYQYVANDDDVEDAESSILTAKKDWYELVKKRNVETAEAVMEIRSRMAQAEQDMADAVLAHDVDAWNVAHDTYITLQDEMKEYMGDAEKAKRDFFKGTAEFFSDVENNTIVPMWDTTVEHLIDKWSSGGEDSFIGSTTNAINQLEAAQETFASETNTLLTQAGVNYNDLVNDGIDPTTEALEDLNETNEELNEYIEEQNDLFVELEESISNAVDAYNELEDAAVSALEAANEALTTLAETAITAVEEISNAASSASSAVNSTASNATNGSGTSSNSGTESAGTQKYVLGVDPNNRSGYFGVYKKGTDTSNKANAIDSGMPVQLKKRYKSGEVQGLYKSGGYTGDWVQGIPGTDNGRLAVLHPKELVLNQADTTNILNAVDSMRELVGSQGIGDFSGITESIISSARMTANILAQVGTSALSALASTVNNNSETQNYRNMTVNADFSGVRSADAIYQALMELDNYGSQQAYSSSPESTRRY